MSIPIYFVQRPFHRERQRDTVDHLPDPFVAISSGAPSVQDHAVNVARSESWRGALAARLARAPLAINAAVLVDPKIREAALLYTWGKLPYWPRDVPFAVELDNPFVLTLYHNLAAHRRLRRVLRRRLLDRDCAGIVTISDACMRTLGLVLGDDVAGKARRIYPYVEPAARPVPVGEGERLEILFVGTQFWVKGGRELCLAFERLARDRGDVALTVVSRTPQVIRRRFTGAPITFVDPVPRRTVVNELLPRSDVAILPTMQESFGMFALEAVAAGVPTIATDVYALAEIVGHDSEGLLPDPLGLWVDGLPDPALWKEPDLGGIIARRRFPEFEKQIEAALRSAVDDRAALIERARAAAARHEQRFSVDRWTSSLRRALGEFTSRT